MDIFNNFCYYKSFKGFGCESEMSCFFFATKGHLIKITLTIPFKGFMLTAIKAIRAIITAECFIPKSLTKAIALLLRSSADIFLQTSCTHSSNIDHKFNIFIFFVSLKYFYLNMRLSL